MRYRPIAITCVLFGQMDVVAPDSDTIMCFVLSLRVSRATTRAWKTWIVSRLSSRVMENNDNERPTAIYDNSPQNVRIIAFSARSPSTDSVFVLLNFASIQWVASIDGRTLSYGSPPLIILLCLLSLLLYLAKQILFFLLLCRCRLTASKTYVPRCGRCCRRATVRRRPVFVGVSSTISLSSSTCETIAGEPGCCGTSSPEWAPELYTCRTLVIFSANVY